MLQRLPSTLNLLIAIAVTVTTKSIQLPYVSAALCEVSTDGIAGIGSEYSIPDLGKLSVVGFDASVKYTYLPPGTLVADLVVNSKNCLTLSLVTSHLVLSFFLSLVFCRSGRSRIHPFPQDCCCQ